MTLTVEPEASDFGAAVTGVNLSRKLSEEAIAGIREPWLKHLVLYFPDQPLTHEQLAQFSMTNRKDFWPAVATSEVSRSCPATRL